MAKDVFSSRFFYSFALSLFAFCFEIFFADFGSNGLILNQYILLFLSLLNLFLFIIYLRHNRFIFYILNIIFLIQFIFYNFFGRYFNINDIKIFFLHLEETFETLIGFSQIIIIPFIYFVFIVFLFVFISSKLENKNNSYENSKIWIVYFFVYIFLTLFAGIKSGFFIVDIFKNSTPADIKTIKLGEKQIANEKNVTFYKTPFCDQKEAPNIVFLMGESLRWDYFSLFGYEKETTPFLKSMDGKIIKSIIFSAATNTDVVLPMFINFATDPSQIDLENSKNIFQLAKECNYETSFISTQSAKSMINIKPFIENGIDFYQETSREDLKDKYDFLLVDYLAKTDLNKKNFIFLQQIGAHSPYIYYPKAFSIFNDNKNSKKNLYENSIRYTDELIKNIYQILKKSGRETIFVISSDHGEFVADGGRWGHNSFEEQIYKTFYIIFTINFIDNPDNQGSSINFNSSKIANHLDLAILLAKFMGYETNYSQKTIKIFGTMIDAQDGFIEFEYPKY